MKPEVEKLRATVEKLYKLPVRFESVVSDDPGEFGQSEVDARDGTPIVRWNLKNNLMDETIAHELHHLQLRKEGFPIFTLKKDAGSGIDLYWLRERIYRLYEPILHVVIFQLMKGMGLDPHAYTRKFYSDAIKRGDVRDESAPVDRTLYYMRACLECQEAEKLAEITQWFHEKKWDDAIENGKHLASLVRDALAHTPDECAKTLLKVTKEAFHGQLVVTPLPGRESRKGSHADRELVFHVTETQKQGTAKE